MHVECNLICNIHVWTIPAFHVASKCFYVQFIRILILPVKKWKIMIDGTYKLALVYCEAIVTYRWHILTLRWLQPNFIVSFKERLKFKDLLVTFPSLIGIPGSFFRGGPTICFCQNSILFCQKKSSQGGAKFSNSVLPSRFTILLSHTVLPVLTFGKKCWMMTKKQAKME